MTKMRMPDRVAPPSRRALPPFAFNLVLAGLVAYLAWIFYRTPALAGFLLQAVRNSLGL